MTVFSKSSLTFIPQIIILNKNNAFSLLYKPLLDKFIISDPSKDTCLTLDGKKVTVPQGKPVSQPEYHQNSSFSQSEYLVYQENQVKMRYIFEMEM